MKKVLSVFALSVVSSLALAQDPTPTGHLTIQNGTSCLEDDYGRVTLVKPVNIYVYSYNPKTNEQKYAGVTVAPNVESVIPLFVALGTWPTTSAAYLGTDEDNPKHVTLNVPLNMSDTYLVVQSYTDLNGNVCPRSNPCVRFAFTATAKQCVALLRSQG